MTQSIFLKRSAVPGKEPTISQLGLGELAINTNDGKVFLKKDDGTEAIVEVGAVKSVAGKTGDVSLAVSDVSGLQAALDSKLEQETVTSLTAVGNELRYTNEAGVTQTVDLSIYLDDTNLAYIVSGVYDAQTQSLVFSRNDGSTFSVDASMFFDDTNMVTSVAGKTGAVTLEVADVTGLQTALDGKVDEVAGKGLSTEDYTTAEKSKLAGIEAGAQVNTVTSVAGKTGAVTLAASDVSGLATVATSGSYNDLSDKPTIPSEYSLPVATATVLGGVKEGSGVSIDIDGSLSADVVSVAGKTGAVTLTKSDVGLANVDNTADADKSVASAVTATRATHASGLRHTSGTWEYPVSGTAPTSGQALVFNSTTNAFEPGTVSGGSANTNGIVWGTPITSDVTSTVPTSTTYWYPAVFTGGGPFMVYVSVYPTGSTSATDFQKILLLVEPGSTTVLSADVGTATYISNVARYDGNSSNLGKAGLRLQFSTRPTGKTVSITVGLPADNGSSVVTNNTWSSSTTLPTTYTNQGLAVTAYSQSATVRRFNGAALSADSATSATTATTATYATGIKDFNNSWQFTVGGNYPSDGQALVYNALENRFQPQSVSGSGGVTSIIAGTGISISSTGPGGTGNVTINATGGGGAAGFSIKTGSSSMFTSGGGSQPLNTTGITLSNTWDRAYVMVTGYMSSFSPQPLASSDIYVIMNGAQYAAANVTSQFFYDAGTGMYVSKFVGYIDLIQSVYNSLMALVVIPSGWNITAQVVGVTNTSSFTTTTGPSLYNSSSFYSPSYSTPGAFISIAAPMQTSSTTMDSMASWNPSGLTVVSPTPTFIDSVDAATFTSWSANTAVAYTSASGGSVSGYVITAYQM